MDTNYKRTIAGSVGAGIGAIFNGSGRSYYILEHKTDSKYHHIGESQKIIVDQIELGRDSSCQVRFDESFETVSRHHAAIVKDGENWKLIPLSQTNATFVNGQPINAEWHLTSGDEIRLSSKGPLMGFIIPQGKQSLVNSIGLTERMNLFRQQALRPYKRAIIVLAVVLVLAVAGLVAWNIYQARNYEEKIDGMKEKQEQISAQVAEKDDEIAALNQDLLNYQDKTEEEIKATKRALAKAEADKKNLLAEQEKIQKNIDDMKAEQAAKAEAAEIAVEEDVALVAADEDEEGFVEDITACYDAVYYIKMNDVSVYNLENEEIVRFNTERLIGGTGFLLEDGRFLTARRVVEPWFYYEDTELGKDSDGYIWTFNDVQVCANFGYRVVANYTAYSPSGANFQFKSTDMRGDNNFVEAEKYLTTEYKLTNNRTVYKFFKKRIVTLRWYYGYTRSDWASMAKRDQLNSVQGLAYDSAESLSPVGNTGVNILGYPLGGGFGNSESVNPVNHTNNINVTGLNDIDVIELSSRRYRVGNDGAPVLLQKGGKWYVIGVLSHTDNSDRDVVVPISYTR